jgi:hypothetical protein
MTWTTAPRASGAMARATVAGALAAMAATGAAVPAIAWSAPGAPTGPDDLQCAAMPSRLCARAGPMTARPPARRTPRASLRRSAPSARVARTHRHRLHRLHRRRWRLHCLRCPRACLGRSSAVRAARLPGRTAAFIRSAGVCVSGQVLGDTFCQAGATGPRIAVALSNRHVDQTRASPDRFHLVHIGSGRTQRCPESAT